MDKNFEEFLDKTIDDISEMYSNDEFRDGYAEAVETFKNAILDYAEENFADNTSCRVLEFDPDYDSMVDMIDYICMEVKGKKTIDYMTTSWNDSTFLILLLEKE